MRPQSMRKIFGVFRTAFVLALAAAVFCGCADDNGNGDGGVVGGSTGSPAAENSSVTVSPSCIPDDGESLAYVKVVLADENGDPLPDGIEVLLDATMGSIISDNPVAISEGRAQFVLQAPDFPGKGFVSLPGYPEISVAEIVFGSLGSGIPASILVNSVNRAEIAVTGVGGVDNSAVRLEIVDEAGNYIDDTAYILNVRMLSRPHGGERFSQGMYDTDTDIDIHTPIVNGISSFNVQSGKLPGAVEMEAEVINAEDGNPLDPPVKSLLQRISIASGPPHIVFLDVPDPPKVVDLTDGPDGPIPQTPGFFSMYAGLSVNDRWGNPVPDGTVINMGVMDSVISSGTGSITQDSNVLVHTDGDVDFETDYLLRSGKQRYIEPGDRVLIKEAASVNKSRFVEDPVSDGPHRIYVNRVYEADETVEYVVGASLLGGSIHGCNPDGTATKGTVITKEGLGRLCFVYPSGAATEHEGDASVRVMSVFTASEGSGFSLIEIDEALEYRLPE